MEEKPIMEKNAAAAAEEEEQVLLPGFRFHPTDEELLSFYLRRKVQRRAFSIDLIREVDICKHDPWDLPKASCGGEMEWYFFCLRGRKYRNSIRPNRVTGSGFWKATGIDRAVYGGRPGDVCIGLKKSLVYYRGSAGKGTKTDWMMHEFRLPPPSITTTTNNNNNSRLSDRHSLQEAEIWTICRIFKRTSSYKKSELPTKFNQKTNIVSSYSSSKACSFESDLGESSSGYPHEEGKSVSNNNNNNNNNNKYYEKNRSDKCYQNNEGQYLCNNYSFEQLCPAAAQPLYCEIAPPATTANCEMNDWFNDGNWDELENIAELMNDHSVAYQFQYY